VTAPGAAGQRGPRWPDDDLIAHSARPGHEVRPRSSPSTSLFRPSAIARWEGGAPGPCPIGLSSEVFHGHQWRYQDGPLPWR